MNYPIYPCKNMRITQNYYGTTSHKPHTTAYYKDYPIDEGGKDATMSEMMYCPCDEMRIVKIYGVGNGGTNTIWFESTTKVNFADGSTDYMTMMVTHPTDANLRGLRTGQKFRRGQAICKEGTDGGVGSHFHFSFGKGKYKGNGWRKNSNGKWVLYCTHGGYRPQSLLYVDKSFTKIIDSKGMIFKEVPKTAPKPVQKYSTGSYKVVTTVLNVRTGAGTKYPAKKYSQLTKSAQSAVKKHCGYCANGYVKNLVFTALEVKGDWGRSPSGWVHLGYCKKV